MDSPSHLSIEARNIFKTFSDGNHSFEVIKDLNLGVAQGEMIGIVGASGSGKSTLLHILGGLDTPDSGAVYVDKRNITHLSEKSKGKLRNHYLGFIYQFHHLLPEFTALENVAMPLLIRGLRPKKALILGREMISHVGLQNRELHRFSELSGGERQRIAIARALVTRPKCVLADEPTGNLDCKSAEQVCQLMTHLNQAFNTSFITVTHSENMAKQLHRCLVLKNGTLDPL